LIVSLPFDIFALLTVLQPDHLVNRYAIFEAAFFKILYSFLLEAWACEPTLPADGPLSIGMKYLNDRGLVH
jgi:hypothetical protein